MNCTANRLLKMFESQMWCFGQDITHKENNLLIEYGFSSEKPPEKYPQVCSRYSLQKDTGLIMLWSFQVCSYQASEPAVILRRQRSDNLLLSNPQELSSVWCADHRYSESFPLRKDTLSSVHHSMHTMLDFFLDYERWISMRCGDAYRQAVVARQPRKNTLLKGEALTDFWQKTLNGGTSALVV